MKVNDSIPFGRIKLYLFSLIISVLEITTTFFYIMILFTPLPMHNISKILFLILIISTTFLYFELIYKHSKNMHTTYIRTKSSLFQFIVIISVSYIYLKFIYNPPTSSIGNDGGPGGMWIIFAMYFLILLPVALNFFAFFISVITGIFKRLITKIKYERKK